MKKQLKVIEQLLLSQLSAIDKPIYSKPVTELARVFLNQFDVKADVLNLPDLRLRILELLVKELEAVERNINQQENWYAVFLKEYQSATSEADTRYHIALYLNKLGCSRRQVRGDLRALSRWFGVEAIRDRYLKRISELEQKAVMLCNLLAGLFVENVGNSNGELIQAHWRRLDIEGHTLAYCTHRRSRRLVQAAFDCLSKSMRTLPAENLPLQADTLSYIYQICQDQRRSVWLQCEALNVIAFVQPEHFASAVTFRLQDTLSTDAIFYRYRVVSVLCEHFQRIPGARTLLSDIPNDSSGFVRQALINGLLSLPSDLVAELLPRFAADHDSAVRMELVLTLPQLAGKVSATYLLSILLERLQGEESELLLRAWIEYCPQLYRQLQEAAGDDSSYDTLRDALSELNQHHPLTSIRRFAAISREDLWAIHGAPSLLRYLQHGASSLAMHDSVRLKIPAGSDREELGRALALIGRKRHGLDARVSKNSVLLTAGYEEKLRFWRVIHETRHPATDKRQNYPHWRGKVFSGIDYAPPEGLCEMSPTTVPGEPLYIDDEGGWRPWLPLPDQLISALDSSWPTKTLCIYTAEGITELVPPDSVWQRTRAKLMLSWKFAHYAALRNAQNQQDPRRYLEAVTALGFTVRIKAYSEWPRQSAPVDSRIKRFFPAFIPVPVALDEYLLSAQQYLYSVYHNTLSQLALFCFVFAAGFFSRHLAMGGLMRRARQRLPLVIGGWGSRGKSGTERLKAALVNGLGYSVVSKTTGCEAMFLYAPANAPMKELFLFRPYDKATIWEQVNLVRMAAKLGANTFLWECMGLTPRYIEILQQQWMRDDISTVTNCYPDHEDLQGPSGIEIPKVMQKFVPRNAVMLTTEVSMLPLLEDAAKAKNTEIHYIDYRQAARIPKDILTRFPYEEHPNNIALVATMAETLGVSRDFSYKEMADNMVPDIGVLKVFPPAQVRGRHLSFINGMSANERLASLSNWRRLSFDKHSLAVDPQIWVSTLINNRADRVSRSKVFAALIAEELSADRHILIGDNLDGLQNYLHSAWLAYIEQTMQAVDLVTAGARLVSIAKRLRVPQCFVEVQGRLVAMLEGLGLTELAARANDLGDCAALRGLLTASHFDYSAEVRQQFEYDARRLEEFVSCAQSHDISSISRQLGDWFVESIVVLEDFHADGNDVVNKIIDNTPPGLSNRLMGMQNIKGTGLDFVYKCQAWDKYYALGEMIRSGVLENALPALRNLAGATHYDVLEQEYLTALLQDADSRPELKNEESQVELQRAKRVLKESLPAARGEEGDGDSDRRHPLLLWLIDIVESVLDAGEAIKRRKKADLIYRELINERISYERAAVELRKLTRDQKGGWLRGND